jgi:hypothetical protein
MDLIYSGARCVRICVRDTSPSTHLTDYKRLFHFLRGSETGVIEDIDQSLSLSLAKLVSLRYFSRVWVIQEVALARAAYLLVNDQEILLTSSVMDRLTSICRQNRYEVPSVLKWYPRENVEVDIITCLNAGMRCSFTDPRDRVFAVLGLMSPQVRLLIPVDYSLDTESVYTSAIVAIIVTRRKLDILHYASINNGNLTRIGVRDLV